MAESRQITTLTTDNQSIFIYPNVLDENIPDTIARVKDLNNKQDALSETQLEAINSGITSDVVSQVSTNTFAITELQGQVAGVISFNYNVVDELPSEGVKGTIYLVHQETTTENNIYNEFLWINDKWELIGNTSIDLTQYATKTDLESKQDTLVSGVNIKTINNQSILGSGNLTISGDVKVDDALSLESTNPVQNKVITNALNNTLTINVDDVDDKTLNYTFYLKKED